ncbi:MULTISPECIES: flagellin [Thalassobaculum]|uniref:Flagellin n=1 Tax=Thalassobaculum litoreum DSM 18839 TaxID=1123362 RepID=A0A8G2EXN9_9PROT|nr:MULTISPECIES: flagellin [Thalassobaculum]SDG27664.1 flagellin [Thalassobaculum litoreum DSM 18839]
MAVQNSINTNPASFVALRNLNSVNRTLDTIQNRVSTGLKVTGALDDASNFAIAQGIRGELKAIGAVTQGLNNAKGIGKVAIAGTTGISDLLQTVRQKLTELSNEGITTQQRDILTTDFNQLLSQAANFIDNAVFNGVNLLDTTNASPDVNTLSNLTGGTLTLTGQDLRTTTLSLAAGDVSSATNAQGVIANEYANLESVVNAALGSLGAEVRALELQTSFLEQISDATEEGLGNIVDADLARESARLTSKQVQQQLSIQTLGIANQRPQTLLGLFG